MSHGDMPTASPGDIFLTNSGLNVVGELEFSRPMGQEWCRPPAGMSIDGLVTIDTMRGSLVLCNVEQWRRGFMGGIRRKPVQYGDLAQADVES